MFSPIFLPGAWEVKKFLPSNGTWFAFDLRHVLEPRVMPFLRDIWTQMAIVTF